jgi:hypothetical protein
MPKKNSLTCFPLWLKNLSNFLAPVAQLDRVPDYESVGRRFESCRARQNIEGLQSSGCNPFFYWLKVGLRVRLFE